MIARDALYTFIENLIDASTSDDALYEAISFRNHRSDVDAATKVVRVDVIDGLMVVTDESSRKEEGVKFTIQFWVTPDSGSDELAALDDAKDVSFDMARQFFDALHEDQSLGGTVCLADADFFETGVVNMAGSQRGVTYLDGEVNPIGFG